MKGKTVVVTGSSDNIGRAIALQFAALSANLVINARNNVKGGESVAREITERGGKAIFVQADVSTSEGSRAVFAEANRHFGYVDVLINNAGSFQEGKFLETNREHWQNMFETNLFSAVLCSLEAGKLMRDRGGKIINMSSIRGLERGGRPGGIAYSAAKAAVINFTKTLAQELAPYVQVNAVAPGFTKTTAFDRLEQEVIDGFLDTTLLKRWLTPDEVAEAFVFLAKSDGITGEVLVVDAGWNAK